MVHSEVYLDKYVVSIALFSTSAFTPPHPQFKNVRKMSFLHVFAFLIFFIHFFRGIS